MKVETGWLIGFLIGVFSTLALVDFRLLELWQKGVVLLALGALIGDGVLLRRWDLARDRAKGWEESCDAPALDPRHEENPETWVMELPLPEPESVLPPFPERLADVWKNYLSKGDGRFTPEGLRRFLDEAGLWGQIYTGEILGAGEGLLAVDLGDGSGRLYLLPDFGRIVPCIAQWFHAPNAGSRLTRINRLVEPAVVQHSPAGLELERHGVVE